MKRYDVECGRCGRMAITPAQTRRLAWRQLAARNWHRAGRSWRCPNCAALATLPRLKKGGMYHATLRAE